MTIVYGICLVMVAFSASVLLLALAARLINAAQAKRITVAPQKLDPQSLKLAQEAIRGFVEAIVEGFHRGRESSATSSSILDEPGRH